MAIALRPGEVDEFVTPADLKRPETERTTFLLKHPPYPVRMYFATLIGRVQDDPEEITKAILLLARTSLGGWRNFRDASGLEIEFKSARMRMAGVEIEIASDESFELLDFDTVTAIVERARQNMNLTDDEAKN